MLVRRLDDLGIAAPQHLGSVASDLHLVDEQTRARHRVVHQPHGDVRARTSELIGDRMVLLRNHCAPKKTDSPQEWADRCTQLVATAKSAIVASSVSPERCDMTAR